MATYLISVDLIGKNRDSDGERLRKRLRELRAIDLLYSQWLISTGKSPTELARDLAKCSTEEIRQRTLPAIDVRKDRLLILALPRQGH